MVYSIKPSEISHFKSGRITRKEDAAFAEYERREAELAGEEFEDGVDNTYAALEEKFKLRRGILSQPIEVQARYGIFDSGRLRVVGTGAVANPDTCGKWVVSKVCFRSEFHPNVTVQGERLGEQVTYRKVKASCGDPLCPVCAASYCGREAGKIEARIKAIIDFWARKGVVVTVEHVIVSVKPDSAEAMKWILSPHYGRERTNEALRVRGACGGVDICHAHRVRSYLQANREGKEAGRYVAPHMHVLALFFGENNGYGKCRACKSVSSSDCLSCGFWEGVTRREYLKDHLICKVAEERSAEDSDFTANAIRDLEHKRSLDESRSKKGARKSIGGSAAYQLSHAAVEVPVDGVGRKRVVSWWGIASYSKFKMDKPERTVRLCGVCHLPMESARYVGSKDSIPTADEGLDSKFDKDGLMRWVPEPKRPNG